MERAATAHAGVLPAQANTLASTEATEAGYPDQCCRECARENASGYAVCRDCLESLPDGICSPHVLETLLQ